MSGRPKGTRKLYSQRLTAAEKRKIIRLSKHTPRVKQRVIAEMFGVGVDTIRAIQQAAGVKLFRALTPALEQQIVHDLREGRGQAPVSKKFGISTRKIRALMKKHNIVHAVGDPGLTPAERARIEEAVRQRANYTVHIAKNLGHAPETVRKIAHAILGPGRLLGFPVWPPMQSHFPQREVREQLVKYVEHRGGIKMPNLHDPVSEETLFLLDLIVRRGFDGKLPENHVAFAELVADLCVKQIPRETWDVIGSEQELVKHSFALEFLAATQSWLVAHQTLEAIAAPNRAGIGWTN